MCQLHGLDILRLFGLRPQEPVVLIDTLGLDCCLFAFELIPATIIESLFKLDAELACVFSKIKKKQN